MIVKTFSRKSPSFKSLIEYINKEQELQTKKDLNFQLFHNVSSGRVDRVIQKFEMNDQYRKKRKRGNALYHDIISFSPLDTEKLTKDILLDFAQKYIQTRNPKALYFIQSHIDQNHLHFHACVSGNEYKSEKSTRQSRKDFYNLRVKLEQYQHKNYPELSNSLIYDKMFDFSFAKCAQIVQNIYQEAKDFDAFIEALSAHPEFKLSNNNQTLAYNDINFELSDLGIDSKLFERLSDIHSISEIHTCNRDFFNLST